MTETTPADVHLTARLDTQPGTTPRLHIRNGPADITPYVRLQTVQVEEPDSWPAHGTNVDIGEGKLPRYAGPVVIALPAGGLDVDQIAVAVEFSGVDAMEHLAGLLIHTAGRYREMHDPEQVKDAYPPADKNAPAPRTAVDDPWAS